VSSSGRLHFDLFTTPLPLQAFFKIGIFVPENVSLPFSKCPNAFDCPPKKIKI